MTEKFAWQTGYAAFSVSELAVEKVFEYIKNQKQQHQKRIFQKEYEEFIKSKRIFRTYLIIIGARNRTRTCTFLRILVPETSASTNSAIRAMKGLQNYKFSSIKSVIFENK